MSDEARATPVFSDGNFDTGWAFGNLFTTNSGHGFTFQQQQLSGGNPGKFLATGGSHGGVGNGFRTIRFFSINTDFTFNPSASPLTALSIAFDSREFFDGSLFQAVRVEVGAALRQRGNFYYSNDFGTLGAAGNPWQRFQFLDLTASDFTNAATSGPSQPDFSSTGAPIEFGYYGFANNNFTVSAKIGVDNFALNLGPVNSVAEPAPLLLLGFGLLGLGTRRRRSTMLATRGEAAATPSQ